MRRGREQWGCAAGEKLVPVAEAKRYRKRAQQAEQSVAALEQQIAAQREVCDRQQEEISALKRRGAVDEQLVAAAVVDLDVARLLVEGMLDQQNDMDVRDAVMELRRTKPYLFGVAGYGAVSSGAMSAAADHDAVTLTVAAAMEQAQVSGHRGDLLRYLRARRVRG